MTVTVDYRSDVKITASQFIDILERSTLSERRPVHDAIRMQKMLDHGNVLVTAWIGENLVGVSRALSDFSFCCYLSDLAVDKAYQHKGIGKALVQKTHEVAGLHCTLLLLAAPAAKNYYPKIGMQQFTDCFIIKKQDA